MEENVPSPSIQLLCVYTIYNVTEICSHPFPFPLSLLLCSGSAQTLRMVHLLCMPLGWWLICLTAKLCISKSSLVGVSAMMFLCSLWELTHDFADTFYSHTHIISSVMISCASCFLLGRKFNLHFYLLGGRTHNFEINPVSSIWITKNPTHVSHCLSWSLHWRWATQTTESN